MKEIVDTKNVSCFKLLLHAWLLHQKVVGTVIIGANKPEQLSDNLKAVKVQFSKMN
ncbi:MAG: aldo/keto reductase [Saprospiraceae bacterium]